MTLKKYNASNVDASPLSTWNSFQTAATNALTPDLIIMENKTPNFKRPNPQGARSKSKIVRVAGRLYRLVATIQNPPHQSDAACVITSKGESFRVNLDKLSPARPGDESNFNAQYQRHLRKVDADKIKHPRK